MKVRAQDRSAAEPPAPAKQELLWPYYARILAICMVVLIHTVAGSVTHSGFGSHRWWGAVLLDSSASWAVPVFVMMSGALLLTPGRWAGAAAFYRRRLLKIGTPALAWIGIYFAYRHWYLDQDFGIRQVLRLTLGGHPYVHLFFLFVILGLYASTPLLRILVANLSWAQLVGLTGVWLTLSSFNEFIGSALGVPASPNAISLFIPYIGYFFAGYLLGDVVVKGIRAWLLVAGVVVATVGEAVGAFHLHSYIPLGKFSALSIAMSIMAYIVLLQVGRIATERGYTGRIARILAGAAFGVYLVHLIVLQLFTDAVGINLQPATAGGLAVALVVTIVVSWAVILVIQRIPLLKRIV